MEENVSGCFFWTQYTTACCYCTSRDLQHHT